MTTGNGPSFHDAVIELANGIASCERLTILERTPLLGKLQAVVRAHGDDVNARLDAIVGRIVQHEVPENPGDGRKYCERCIAWVWDHRGEHNRVAHSQAGNG